MGNIVEPAFFPRIRDTCSALPLFNQDSFFEKHVRIEICPKTGLNVWANGYAMKCNLTITETLRKAVAASDGNFLQIERATGIVRQSLMKFSRGEQQIKADKMDRLAQYFGLELMPKVPLEKNGK